ncbi:MAG: SusC/RagA family TonB-linked outer membrane protein [Marinilabiliales bacterium]|nr:MAG: SusC/RagA family TonB-linked outer membrane protein [Marinilabiliales bacterium]
MKKYSNSVLFRKKLLLRMKLTFYLMLICAVQLSASVSMHGQVTLSVHNESIRDVLREIETQSPYRFFYNEAFADLNKRVNINVDDTDINSTMDELLLMSDMSYRVLENNLVVIAPRKELQQHVVSGRVTDASNNDPLPGVNVFIEGTTTGTITDIDGRYTLNVPDDEVVLVFSYIGYVREEIPVGGRQVIDVGLKLELEALDEVVVIGYGARRARDVTTSISSIASEEIARTISMTPELAMQGQMAGVQVGGVSGNPMARPEIRIRGVNTWGISNPLYVIDGIPVTEYGAGYEGIEDLGATDIRGPLNIMAMIDPNDIESISVLKDASAAAIYGVRAANGVILITTKRGQLGAPSVEFSSRFGIQNIPQHIDVLNTAQYTSHIQRVHASDPEIPVDPENEGLFDPSHPRYLGNSPTYNWQDALKNHNAPTQDYSLRISGATDRVDYSLSGSFADTEGALVHNNLQRYSGSFQINARINDWLRAGVNYRISQAEGRDNSFRINFWQYAMFPPWQPIYDEDGPGGYAPTVGGVRPDGTYSSAKLYGQGTRLHDIGSYALNDAYYETDRNMGNLYFELEPVTNFTIRAQISRDIFDNRRFEFTDKRTSVFDYTRGDPRGIGGPGSVGTYAERLVNNTNLVKEVFANYSASINGHNMDLLFSGMDQQYNSKFVSYSSEYMSTTLDYLRFIDGSVERELTSTESSGNRYSLQGLLGRIGYNYQYTYYLDLIMRRDGSARFAPENRWGTFPAVSAAWRVTNERFMENVNWLDDLKLRAGWGQLGNQEVRDMAYLSVIDTRPAYSWGRTDDGLGYYSSGATVFGIANRDLQWEKTTTFNIGFDAVLFRGLYFTAEYYDKLTDGILQTVSLPNSVGVTLQPVDNIASVRNSGVELALNYTGRIGELGYSMGGNFTLNDNEVVSTHKGIPLFGQGIEEGYPLFYVRGYKLGGIFQNQSEIDAWLAENSDVNYQTPKLGPGDFYFQDLRGAPQNDNEFYSEGPDGTIDSYDQVYLGNSIPGYFYGFNMNLTYRGFDMGAVFTGVGDVVKYNVVRQSLEYTSGTGGNLSTDVLNSWTPENRDTDMPRIMRGDPAGNFRASDYFVESAAYLRLSNLQVGYTLPQSFYAFTNDNIRNLRIYLGVSNLFTITPYRGLDPESDKYPTPRVLFMGLNARF